MKTKSITFKVIAFVAGVFLVTLVAVMALVDSQLRTIVDRNQHAVYESKIGAVFHTFSEMDRQLRKTGLVDAYINDFQSRALSDFERSHQNSEDIEVHPIIIDGKTGQFLHPKGSTDNGHLHDYVLDEGIFLQDSGEFISSHLGRDTWYVFERFESWDWVVVYAVPLDIKYRELTGFRKMFAAVFVGIGVVAFIILIWMLSRITNPIVELTNLTAEIAQGNLDKEIRVSTEDEVGILAESFNGMRDAIRVRIDELNKEVAVRRKAEADSAIFKSALAASSDAVGMSTPDGMHYYQNDAFDNMFGDIGDDPPATLYVDGELGREVFSVIMGGGRWEGELQMNGSSGQVLDILLRAYSIKDDDGNIVQLIGVHTDITEIKRAAAALEKRIVALTQPLNSGEGIAFDDLFNIEDVQKLQDEFSEATGVASIITRTDGTPITRPSNFCRLCKDIIRKTKRGYENCLKSDAALGRMNTDGPTVQPCQSCGLWDAGAPITVGGEHIANWLIGQVRDELQSDATVREYAHDIGADEEEMVSAFYEVPTMSKDKFGHVAQALVTLANQFSNSAYQNVQQARFIAERKAAEEELKRNEENLRTTLNSIGDAVISTAEDGNVQSMNPVAESLTGWDHSEAVGKPIEAILKVVHFDTREELDVSLRDVLKSGDVATFDNPMTLVSKDGREYRIAVTVAPIRDDAEEIRGAVMVFRDVTQELEIQEQLRHSQKMDAIGQLAGGVAHDFNNMLGGIMGSAELLKLKLDDEGAIPIVDMIIESADRAAGLTQKLLTFARKQPTLVKPINVGRAVADSVALLTSTIDRRIDVKLSEVSGIYLVNGDSGLLQNAILNLGINASHAMPDGGTVEISTSTGNLDEPFCSGSVFDLQPGMYYVIKVRDTGAGISSDDLPRIYEPFFTTKGQGKGTGLGLAAVYGTVLQHKGAITVESTVGVGTCFTVYLPLLQEDPEILDEDVGMDVVHGSGTVMVVDDEPVMRNTAEAILTNLGYEVTLAEDGLQALDVFKASPESFDVVLLDMVMPKMNGRDCFEKMRELSPGVKVVLASGYADDEDVEAMVSSGLSGYISKPFTRKELSHAIFKAISG